jgi:hypothetical protein
VTTSRRELLGLGALLAAVTAFHLWWWSRERRDVPWFIDEAGYLVFAIEHGAAIADGSLSGLGDSLDGQVPAAPLVPLLTGLGLAVADRPVVVAALTMALSAAALVAAAWWLARWYLPAAWALLAAGVVAALPAVLTLGGSYYFATFASACFVAGVACLDRSGWGLRFGWSAAAGVALAAAALSRTMLAGFVPAVAVVAVAVAVWRARRFGEPLRRRVAGMALAAGVAVLCLAPWFLRHLDAIVDYLGADQPSRAGGGATGGGGGAWRVTGMRDLRLLIGDLLVPMAVALLVTGLLGAGWWLAGRRARPAGDAEPDEQHETEPLAPIAGVAVLGAATLVLTSQAIGQWLPLLPLAVVVALAGVRRSAPAPVARGVAAGLVALSLFQVASASRIDDGLSRLRLVDAGPLGRVPVTDTRTLLEDQFTGLLRGAPLDERFLAVPPLLDDIVEEAVDRSRALDEPAVLLVAGGQDPLLNVNSLPLADHLADGDEDLVVGGFELDADLAPADWVELLADPARGQPNSLLTIRPSSARGPTRQAYDTLVETLPGAGFEVVLEAELPDGRPAALWFRSRADTGTYP